MCPEAANPSALQFHIVTSPQLETILGFCLYMYVWSVKNVERTHIDRWTKDIYWAMSLNATPAEQLSQGQCPV